MYIINQCELSTHFRQQSIMDIPGMICLFHSKQKPNAAIKE